MDINNFLDDVITYINISGNEEMIKRKIGLKKALQIRTFLGSFIEAHETEIEEFVREYGEAV